MAFPTITLKENPTHVFISGQGQATVSDPKGELSSLSLFKVRFCELSF